MRWLLIGGAVWMAASIVTAAVLSLLWRKGILKPTSKGPLHE